MAQLLPDRRSGKLTLVGWSEVQPDGKTVDRVKQLHTKKKARLYKALVDENGERTPSYVTLAKYNLIRYGYEINPEFILMIRGVLLDSELTAEAKVEFVSRSLSEL